MVFKNQFPTGNRSAEECDCPVSYLHRPRSQWKANLHLDPQDFESEAWSQLNALIDQAVETGARKFEPGLELGSALWQDIVTLPSSIGRLAKVETLDLYGSNLRSIPPEIGEMTALRTFTPYTSYRLHWFPYEITRCADLNESTVSTRALYGNLKYRPTFPELPANLPPKLIPSECSVCRQGFDAAGPIQQWTSLRVATDVLPLLVHACSESCLAALPQTPDGYVPGCHQGGVDLVQPESN